MVGTGRKLILAMGVGKQEKLLRLSRSGMARYAAAHGYELRTRTEPWPTDRPIAWGKVAWMREALDEGAEAVLWLDADLMVVDRSRDILDDLPEGRSMGLVAHEFPEKQVPNTGVWLLRGDDWSRRFLDAVWAREQWIDHRWWENAAVMDLLGYDVDGDEYRGATEWSDGVEWLDHRWNSIPDAPADRPRIKHYPGYTVTRRAVLMARDRTKVSLPVWCGGAPGRE